MPSNETNLHRAARRLQRASELTYQQARQLLSSTDDRPDFDDEASVAAFVARKAVSSKLGVLSVYVTTTAAGFGDIAVDGDVVVRSFDWANGDRHDTAADVVADFEDLTGLPAGLLDAIRYDIITSGFEDPELPEAGPDRPWAYVTFCDQTFASEGVYRSEDVTVVYHDWSLWFADLAIGCEPLEVEHLEAAAATLGPKGQAVAAAVIADYRAEIPAES